MPELPDIAAYIKGLETRVIGQPLMQVRSASPFLLRTVKPSLRDAQGRTVRELRRIGKRIAIGVEGDLWLVLHLMIAGRLHWRQPRQSSPGTGIWRLSIFRAVHWCAIRSGIEAARLAARPSG